MLKFYCGTPPRQVLPTRKRRALASMQTQVIHRRPVGTARLERHTANGTAEQTWLETFPFTVGRNETADLHIPSSRVSREHAILLKHGNLYRVQDLGSTNGTLVNGKRIEEAVLHDGDLLAFADEEFTFVAGDPATSRQTVTQVIDRALDEGIESESPATMIQEVRRVHEVLTHCAVAHAYEPVIDLATGRVAGYEAVEPGDAEPSVHRSLAATECRLTSRLRWLSRLVAIEGAMPLPSGVFLMVPLHASDLGSPWLAESLQQLASILGEPHQLMVEVPECAVSDNSCFDDFCDRLREADVSIAYSEFAGTPSRIGQLRRKPPDLLKLASAATRGTQRRTRLEAMVRAAGEIGARLVATGISRSEEAESCRKAGCDLAQGGFAGPPLRSPGLGKVVGRAAESVLPVLRG